MVGHAAMRAFGILCALLACAAHAETVKVFSNQSTDNVTIGSVALSGANAGDFTRGGTCAAGLVLTPGQSCTVTVAFNPSATGPRAANVVITSDANGSPHSIALSGIGTSNAPPPPPPPTPVTTFTGTSATGSGTVTATFNGGGANCTFSRSALIPVSGNINSPPAGTAPQGVQFPHGLFDFALSGCTAGSTVNFTITYPQPLPANTQYYKYGPTPGNAPPHWYTLPAVINGNTATFSITDGGLGDDDLTANGSITDQGGPAVPLVIGGPPLPIATQIPTLSEVGLLLLALAVTVIALRYLRRRDTMLLVIAVLITLPQQPASAGDVGLDQATVNFGNQQVGTSSAAVTINYSNATVVAPAPTVNAPKLAGGTASNVSDAIAFLYTGNSPVQTGVAPNTIDPVRASLLRGRVLDRNNQPLAAVTVTILNHPELGQTLTRGDGYYDLAVNGGSQLTVTFAKAPLLPAQRSVDVPWQDYVLVPDVVLIGLDTQVTTIVGNAANMQVARGSVVTDSDGTRRETIFFPPGTTATMLLPNGTTQPLSTASIRATEYTVGANGPLAMPAELPPASAYTYAVELSADEAIAANAKRVDFNQAVITYVENFLNFPVGTSVPNGYYDRDLGAWLPDVNGRVVKIIAISGGIATVDTVGTSGQPALTLSNAERQQLASVYAVGQTLWRSPITHFSSWDRNWGWGPPPNSAPPKNPPPTSGAPAGNPNSDPCLKNGSIIGCESRTLGEGVAVSGTGFTLNYDSSRVPGRKDTNAMTVPLSGSSLPPGVKRIDMTVAVAGRRFAQSFASSPNQSTVFNWDGLDAYGRPLLGRQPSQVRVEYVYDGSYEVPASFGYKGNGIPVSADRMRREVSLAQDFITSIGGWDVKSALRLGGWSLSVHHAYDPLGRVLYLGTGERRDSVSPSNPPIIKTVAGGALGVDCYLHPTQCNDGGDATLRPLAGIEQVAVDAVGNLYIAEAYWCRIRKVDRTGTISTIAGVLATTYFGLDQGQCGSDVPEKLNNPMGVVLDAQGNLYIGDTNNRRILKRAPNGTITTFAGTGHLGANCFAGDTMPDDGQLALNVDLCGPGYMATDNAGNLYVSDYLHIRKIDPAGVISTVGVRGAFSPAVDNQGNVYFGVGDDTVRKQAVDGKITIIAGGGHPLSGNGDGGLATQASLDSTKAVALDRAGNIYITQAANGARVRIVRPDGIINTFVGLGVNGGVYQCPPTGENGPAEAATAADPSGITSDSAGNIWIGHRCGGSVASVRKVSSAFPGYSASDIVIPSEDGHEVYVFDSSGRHQRTVHALTKQTLYQFGYDANGLLVSVTDGSGNVTTIGRDANGNPVSVVNPYGQVTSLTVDANGWLASMRDAANQQYSFTSTADGLLTSFRDPRGSTSTFTYDTFGRLVTDADAAGGSQSLASTILADGYNIAVTTALNRVTSYTLQTLASGDERRTITDPAGVQGVITRRLDGTIQTAAQDGSSVLLKRTGDPRWGMQAPVTSRVIATPGGLSMNAQASRAVTLADRSDPFSLTSLTETGTVNGKTFTSTYSANTGTFTQTTPAGRQATTTIDNLGRVVQQKRGSLNASSVTYDARGRPITLVLGTGGSVRTFSLAYNAAGRIASVVDPMSHTTTYAYDAVGRVTQKTLADGRTIAYTYDAMGKLASITPPGRPAHTFGYTSIGLPASYTGPSVSGNAPQTTFSYSPDRVLTAIGRPDGANIAFAYGANGRLTSMTTPEGATTLGYAAATGQVTSIASPGGTTLSFVYDGPLLQATSWAGSVTGNVSHTFDNFFRVATQSVNGVNAVNYRYDDDNLLTAVGALAFTRESTNGLVTASTLGSVTDAITRDGYGQVLSYSSAYNGSALLSEQYAYDALGRISQRTETVGGVASTYGYAYDATGRLTGVTLNGAPRASYAYDANGNRTSANISGSTTSATYDAQDRVTQYGSTAYTHNVNGELTSRTTGGQTTQYQYDAIGNLRGAALPSGTAISYLVDGRYRRIGKKVNGNLVQGFLYADSLLPVAELDESNNVVSRFVYGNRSNVPEYMIRGGITYRIVSDHLGSPRLVVNTATGAIAQRIDYDEFGVVLSDTNPGFQPFGFAGGLYDKDTGLVHFGSREYAPDIGRWIAKDAIVFAGNDVNLYTYARNDPANYADPTGYMPEAYEVYSDCTGGRGIAYHIEVIVYDPATGTLLDGGGRGPGVSGILPGSRLTGEFNKTRLDPGIKNMGDRLSGVFHSHVRRVPIPCDESIAQIEAQMQAVVNAYNQANLPYLADPDIGGWNSNTVGGDLLNAIGADNPYQADPARWTPGLGKH